MNRRGLALLVVLWLLVALSALGAVSLATAREGSDVSRNRVWLRRAEWAREACAEILLGRWAGLESTDRPDRPEHPDRLIHLDSIDLGRGTWCSARLENPNAKLNLNTADPLALRTLLRDEALTDALLDWRDPDSVTRSHGAEVDWYRSQNRRPPRNGPLASVDELRWIRGFDSTAVESLGKWLTTDGDGQVDLNAAAAEVLRTLPGFDEEIVGLIVNSRPRNLSLEGLVGRLTTSQQRRVLGSYQALQQATVTAPPAYLAVAEGWIENTAIRSRASLTLVPVDRRLAVVRRRVE